MKINIIYRKIFLSGLLFLSVVTYGQSKEDILKYLEGMVSINYKYIDNGAFSEMSNMKLVEVRIDLNDNNDELNRNVFSSYFIKNGDKFEKIAWPGQLINMPDFYLSLKESFKLKTPEDGLLLQTALNVISQEERNEGLFNIDTKWYFIRSQFFGRYYIVETDNEGKIIKIKQTKGIEADIPDEIYFKGEAKSYPDLIVPEIDKATSEQITKSLTANITSRFEIEDGVAEYFNKISGASIYMANYIISEEYLDESSESSYPINLITYKGKIASADKIWETDLFLESTNTVFKLKTKNDAELLQSFFNEMDMRNENVRFFKKEDLWFFVREKNFEEEYGYIIKPDEKGNIVRLMYSGFTEPDILRFRMQESEFKVDFSFALKKPTETTFKYNKDELFNAAAEGGDYEYINVEIEFNELAANAVGAWVLTRVNGQNHGIYASTSMTSPYIDKIPITEMEKGEHAIEYLLLRAGQETDNPLGVVKLLITIE
jgi:hypothetical protein